MDCTPRFEVCKKNEVIDTFSKWYGTIIVDPTKKLKHDEQRSYSKKTYKRQSKGNESEKRKKKGMIRFYKIR